MVNRTGSNRNCFRRITMTLNECILIIKAYYMILADSLSSEDMRPLGDAITFLMKLNNVETDDGK